ncbi:MAG: LCP family protein [Acidimicrobiales bacterium]
MVLTHTEADIEQGDAVDTAPEVQVVARSQQNRRRSLSGRPQRPRRSNAQELLITLGFLTVALLLGVAASIVWVQSEVGDLTTAVEGLAAADNPNQTNWLIVGSDSREGIEEGSEGSDVFIGEEVIGRRTDTVMVARLDTDTGLVDLMSLPRDLWVPIDGTARDGRINSAFNGEDGQQRLIDTVQNVLEIDIHHYAEINFVGFQAGVDALGGVPIWFDRALRDPGSGLLIETPGCHVLDGYEALAFARSRKLEFYDGQDWRKDGSGDLGRSTRQKFLLQQMATHATATLDITDVPTMARLLGAAGDNLTVDSGITTDRMVELARVFRNLGGDSITTHVLPTVPFRTPGGSAVLAMQPAEAQPILAVFRGEEPEPIVAEEAAVRLSIYNGSRTPGQAGEVERALGAEGFEIDLIDNGPTTKETLITYGPGMELGAERIARYLEVAPTFVPDPDARGISVTTGTDFEGIRGVPLDADEVSAPEVPVSAGNEPPAPFTATPSIEIGVVPGTPPPGTTCG